MSNQISLNANSNLLNIYQVLLDCHNDIDVTQCQLDEGIFSDKYDKTELIQAKITHGYVLTELNKIKKTLPPEVSKEGQRLSKESQRLENKLTHLGKKISYFEKKLVTLSPSGPVVSHQQFINSIPVPNYSLPISNYPAPNNDQKPIQFQANQLPVSSQSLNLSFQASQQYSQQYNDIKPIQLQTSQQYGQQYNDTKPIQLQTSQPYSQQYNDTKPIPIQLPASQELPPRIVKPLSFTIEEVEGLNNNQPILTPLQILDRISSLFRSGKDQEALQEFSALPRPLQQAVSEALWIVRGKPQGTHPIAHDNFGEVSLKNLVSRCASSPQQKACAVELAKTHAALLEIISAFEKGDQVLANQIFEKLPSKIRNEIFTKHWVVMGQPTENSPDEALRKISHPDFGKVSFLGLEPRCNVALDRKADVMRAYLLDYRKKIDDLQNMVQKNIDDWQDIDNGPHRRGPQKNLAKKESLDKLASDVVSQFLSGVSVVKPNPKGDSFQSLAEAYVETYPCLRPFFLQLIPNLTFANEIIHQGQLPKQRKPSQMPAPNLAIKTDKDQRAYRAEIIKETLDTLHQGFYINSKGQKVTLDLSLPISSLTLQTKTGGEGVRTQRYKTQIFLDKKDCLTVTHELVNRGLNPVVLDAASEHEFGGGYRRGAGAQEEYLCRASALSVVVDPIQGSQKQNFYPLNKPGQGDHACLYASNVPVFRGEEEKGYPYLDQPFETSFIIAAAYNFNEEHQQRVQPDAVKQLISNPYTGEERLSDLDAKGTEKKLRAILHLAQKNNHDSIVLVPFGCGAFRNPPKHVCEIMMKLIKEEFPNSFKEIHFSILDTHNGQSRNPQGNYEVFKATMQHCQAQGDFDKIEAKFIVT